MRFKDWAYSSVTGHLSSMPATLGSIPSPAKTHTQKDPLGVVELRTRGKVNFQSHFSPSPSHLTPRLTELATSSPLKGQFQGGKNLFSPVFS